MSDQSANSDQQIARAEDIVNEIKQESRGLEKLGFPWRKPLLPLKHKTIRGCLDLNSIIHPEFILNSSVIGKMVVSIAAERKSGGSGPEEIKKRPAF